MFFLNDGDIVPGAGIGDIRIGMHKKDIENILSDSTVNQLVEYEVYQGGDVKVWVNKRMDVVTQILVFGGFRGKLMYEYGIGSYLSDIENKLKSRAINERDVYVFDELKGVCFELGEVAKDWDNLQWFKANAPIECISVFSLDY